MEFILDFQGFKDEKNDFIIKELAILSTDGEKYELHLFQPPHAFNQLSKDLQKQVIWLEKQFHGLYWSSGHRDYRELKDVFRGIDLSGTIYVKGVEKQRYAVKLLSDFNVNVINLEDIGCPSLSVLKQQINPAVLKPCSFNHNSNNCAYVNVYVLAFWLNLEKCITDRLQIVNLAIKECCKNGYLKMSTSLIKYLPKYFILNHNEDIEHVYDKLPESLKTDYEIMMNLRCSEHYQRSDLEDDFDGPNPKRKHCYFCRNNVALNPKLSTSSGIKF